MIINQEQSQATVVGEIQNNRVGIDVNNINFITSLLTSNLYSLPIESFLRETIANAWDSQVEANNINTPILVRITQIEDTYDATISIRDYGTGLSPQRFNEIYKNIGSSTKRDSNDYIGALGKPKNRIFCSYAQVKSLKKSGTLRWESEVKVVFKSITSRNA